METRYKVITKHAIYPIDVDETLKRHMNLSTSDTSEDTLLLEYIKSAAEQIQKYIGYPLMTQTIEVSIPDPIDKLQVLTGNVNNIVKYTYFNGTEDVVVTGSEATGLEVFKYPFLSYVGGDQVTWPSGTNFRFQCTAGYTQGTIPDDLIQACRMLVMQMYEDRGDYEGMSERVTNRLDYHVLY